MITLVDKPADADAVLAIDVSNLGWRSAYAHDSLYTRDGRRSGHVYGSIRSLMGVLENELESGKWCLCFCCDGKDAKMARQAKVPSYKANRDSSRWNPISEVEEVLRFIPGLHIKQEGKEGDDALAWVVQKCSSTRPVVLLTGDMDLWALIGPNVKVFSPNLKRYVTQEDVVEHYGITHCTNIPLCKALFGDQSDNIKGIERLQKRQVRPTIDVLASSRGKVPMEGFLAALAQQKPPEMTQKSYDKIISERQRLLDNYSIIVPDLEGWLKESVLHVPQVHPTIEATNKHRVDFEAILKYYECYSLMNYVPLLLGGPIIVKERGKNEIH